ncbi:hypothetical protein CBF29_11340 [Vagococcus elongatus]|uniref:Uncharacterized protein n=1 Tax=Vagococcus elongatus TaxID=180344 RepID=A0A430AMU2_9ENTE|nr:hypothetical protein CBF29_11340 [Vagococcus elongatus]
MSATVLRKLVHIRKWCKKDTSLIKVEKIKTIDHVRKDGRIFFWYWESNRPRKRACLPGGEDIMIKQKF